MAISDLTTLLTHKWWYLLLGAHVAYVANVYYTRYTKRQRVNALGGPAPNIKTSFVFGLDFPVRSTIALLNNKAMELWRDMFIETWTTQRRDCYTAELWLLASERIVFTADVENIKAILATQFDDFGKGQQFHEEWKDFLGDSIFTTDHQKWERSRKLIRPMFVRDKVADLPLIEEHVQQLIGLLGTGDGRQVRFDKLMFRFSLDASTHYLWGRSVGSLLDEGSEFLAAFDEVQRVQVLEGRLGPLRHYHPRRSFNKGLKQMDKFIEPMIDEAMKLSPEELETKLAKSDTFIHALARFTRDRKMIRDQLTSLLLAGRDTTASTMSWLFLELARNPRVVKKLREEVQSMLGDSGRPPTYQEIKDMKYLTYTINETLRLYPVVPFNVRTSLKDTSLPRGGGDDGLSPIGIMKDTPIGYSTLLMQRRRDIYPPISDSFPYDPLDWVPDRWTTWTPKSWQFIPFNGGPRICIGMNFAMIEIGYTIIRILQEFDQIVDFGNRPIMKTEIVITPAEGVKIGFVRRENSVL